ncbi:MAG: polysaccharide deacetylase family protein [Clostridia bacterium]|nr:polysaccharide deacetylase family protein [Clostridia bacterium]
MKKTVLLVICAALVLSTFTSCLRDAGTIDDDAGVGRDPGQIDVGTGDPVEDPTESDTSYAPPPLDNQTGDATDEPATDAPVVDEPTGKMWNVVGGRYVYNIPKPTRDLSDLSDIYATPKTLFADQGKDTTGSWYPGKTVRDPQTGEVTYSWDRYQSTKDLIEKYNAIYRGDEERKVCYLTFDCGYELGYTSILLDTLKEKNCPATFFLVGNYYRDEPELVNRMINEGHIIGNHTIKHPNMTTVSAERFIEELETVEREIAAQFPNANPLRYWRPPMGAANEWVLKLADKMGLVTVMWSFAYYDYDTNNQPTVEAALEKSMAGLHNGCVYLFHTESSTNAAMMGQLIDQIRAAGYEILPLCDIK